MNIVCVSHLRWNFVFQRPQQLLSRAATSGRVLYVEEPTFGERVARFDVVGAAPNVIVGVPRLPTGLAAAEEARVQEELLSAAVAEHIGSDFVLWYYTPMAVPFTRALRPRVTVYDCMDELSGFAGAPPQLGAYERELFARADLVFTGGQSLYEAKRRSHPRVLAFPSSVDVPHFARARTTTGVPADQAAIPAPRIGFFGVIDERMDYELLRAVAAAHPAWHFVLVGPMVKIDPERVPRAANIHYLGPKSYAALPEYIAGWDVAMLPFARNDATRFISPTKTPEYLAAGKPVVSTSIQDVVRPYGRQGLARIADTPTEFAAAIAAALQDDPASRLQAVDDFLSDLSWDGTWRRMREAIEQFAAARHPLSVDAPRAS